MSKVAKAIKAPRAKVSHVPTARRAALVPCTRYDIETVYGLIKAFGGFEATAAEYHIATEQVENWAVSGFIPTGWHLRMFGRVCAMGKTIAPTVFGFREDDQATRALTKLMLQEGADDV